MQNIFDASFTGNKTLLARRINTDKSFEHVRSKLVRLSSPHHGSILIGGPGSFVSVALLQYLAEGKREFVITNDKKHIVKAFYSDLWNQPGHPTIEFLRRAADVRVEFLIVHQGREFKDRIDQIWEDREQLHKRPGARESVNEALMLLDRGVYRIAEPDSSAANGWKVNEWLKKAVLLSFRLNPNERFSGFDGVDGYAYAYDKVPLKWHGWNDNDFASAGFRVVPGAVARRGAYIAKNVVLMPSFVNIGGYVGEGTMIDTWATVGSCAQIGKNCHISGGAGIGGVLEPLQANPVIIEDECFIGARSEVVEGVIVKRRAVLSMGVHIGKNTPIVDRTRDDVILVGGVVPEGAVVIPGAHPVNGLICPHIVKYRDEKTDAATALNTILR